MDEKRKDNQKIEYLYNDDNYPLQTIIKEKPYTVIPCYTKKEKFISENEYKLYKALEQIYKDTDIKISVQVKRRTI